MKKNQLKILDEIHCHLEIGFHQHDSDERDDDDDDDDVLS